LRQRDEGTEEEEGPGEEGIKVSSLVHEEQHLRWLGQDPRAAGDPVRT